MSRPSRRPRREWARERASVSVDSVRGGSSIPPALFLIAGLVWPLVVMQSSSAVFTVVLGVNPRGEATREGLPWNEIVTVGLTILCVGSLLLALTPRARMFGVGWVISGVVAIANALGGLGAALLVSTRASFFYDITPTNQWVAANDASEIAILIGAVSVIAVALLAPFAACAGPSRMRWIEAMYIALMLVVAVYGLVPTIWALVRFG